jgi:CO/xanthine dehydrogenase FAD-binding subunit
MNDPLVLQTNTRILTPEFDYVRAKTVREATQLLGDYGERARILAGGTDLLVQMKMGRLTPEVLIGVTKVAELRGIFAEDDLRLGAAVSFREIQASPIIRKEYTALHEAAGQVSHVQIRAMGTLGGNLCNASPAADSVPPLLVFDAQVKLAQPTSSRLIPLKDFFVGPGLTVVDRQELLVEIRVPHLGENTGSAFLKIGRTHSDLAKVTVAVALQREHSRIRRCAIALGAVAETPMRTGSAEAILIDQPFSQALIEEAGWAASQEIRPITDIRSTETYRRDVAKTLVADALHLAWRRALS